MRKKLRQNIDAAAMPMVPVPGSRVSYGSKSSRHSLHQQRNSSLRTANVDDHVVYREDSSVIKDRTYSTSSDFEAQSIAESSYISSDSSAAPVEKVSDNATVVSNTTATVTTTIAVFGAYGKTGNEFVRLALDAGYRIQAMCLNIQQCSAFADQPNIDRLFGKSLEDAAAIAKTVKGAQYVVCLLDDTVSKKQLSGTTFHQFVRLLYPLLRREQSLKVLLWQAHSLSADVTGDVPVMSQLVKTIVRRRTPNHDKAICYMAQQHNIVESQEEINDDNTNKSINAGVDDECNFSFIVTRPSVWQKDGASARKLAASKSQPGPMPVTHVDLAEFTLNALLKQRLYNTSPYIVADTF